LGLAIVKHAINTQNGMLDIQSTPGKGCSFSCSFPANQLCEPVEAADHVDSL